MLPISRGKIMGKMIPDIIIQGNECYLKEWDIARVTEYPSYFLIEFGYNPEGDSDSKYDKDTMTYSQIKQFKKWVYRQGIRYSKSNLEC